MKKIKTDLKTTQKLLLELPHWVFIEKVDPKVIEKGKRRKFYEFDQP